MSGWTPADLLPGLWVAVLALALAAALRRWFDPVPGRILAVFGLFALVLFGPVLFGDRVLISVDGLRSAEPYRQLEPAGVRGRSIQGDLVFLISPWLLEVERTLGDGRWPLWNHLAGAGMPLMGDPQVQSFHPLVLAAYPFDTWTGVGVTAALRVLAALIFGFLFFRRQGLGEAASLAGSASFGLGGFLLFWLNWPMANAAALLPPALYAVVRCDESGRRRDFLLLAVAAASLLLGGHPETIIYSLGITGAYLLARCLDLWRVESREVFRLLARGGAAFVVAGFLAAPVLLPVQDYLPKTRRAAVVEYQEKFHPSPAEIWSPPKRAEALATWARWAELRTVPFFAPRAFGTHNTAWWGETNIVEDGASFMGTAALFAALAGLLGIARRGRVRFPQEGFFAAVLVFGFALLLQPPGFQWLALRLPVIGPTAAHRHHRFLVVMAFAVAYLAACQIERWRRGERGGRWTVLAVALGLGGAVAWGYLAHPNPDNPGYLSEVRHGWMAAHLAVLALAAACALLLARRHGDTGRLGRWAPWAFSALVAVELLATHQPANPALPRRLAYPVTPPIAFLQERLADGGRMIGLGNVFRAALPSIYGLNDLRIDNPSVPDGYVVAATPLMRESRIPTFARPGHPLYDLLGVRYVLTRPEVRTPFPRVFEHPAGWIYERPGALPPLFLPARAQVAWPPFDWPAWLKANQDFSRRALVPPSPGRDRRWRADRPRASSLAVTQPEPAHFRAEAALAEPRLLASSVFQDGHWRLLVDGRPHPAILANGPFVAAWLPAEARRIDLIYRPWSFLAGCLLAALAFAAAFAWWIPPPLPPVRRGGVLS